MSVRRTLLAMTAALLLGLPATAAADDPWIDAYDGLPVETAWRDALGLPAALTEATGRGVGIAVIDTGATRHPDLDEGRVVRVDLTQDADGYDRYGHGTAMAGVAAGTTTGTAPGARLISIRVAGHDGATDVSTVLAAMEFVAAHRERLGIRVLSLSFGSDSSQQRLDDPLDHAVERLWRAGVTVVVAAGNRGSSDGKVDKPGDDPLVLTVGAADVHGTAARGDDTVAPFSSRGPTAEGVGKPDVVAPGINLASHRAPDSTFDGLRPAARIDERFTKSTGTSPATAAVAGVAALVLERDPALTPDAVKATLVGTAGRELAGRAGAGAGLVDAAAAVRAAAAGTYRGAVQRVTAAGGGGSIDASRGSHKPYTDFKTPGKPEQLSGEVDAFGTPWNGSAWATRPWTAGSWTGTAWARVTGEAAGWAPMPRPAATWSGVSLSDATFFHKYWRDGQWDGGTWLKYWREAPWD